MSKEFESTMKWKVDIKDLKAGMQEAKRSISQANAEFKKSTSGMSSWSKSTDGVKAKITQLKTVLQSQTTILSNMQKQYNIVAKEMGEDSAEAQKLKTQITNQQAAINKTVSSIKDYNAKLNAMEAEEKQANSEVGKLTKEISDQQSKVDKLKAAYKESLVGKNPEEAKKLKKELKEASKELQESKSKMEGAEKAADKLDKSLDDTAHSTDRAKEGFTVLKGVLANLATDALRRVADGVKEVARQTLEVGMGFESGMSKVAAISGASAEQVQQLTDKAKEMGAKTVFSASQSAEAFNYMAMAGWDVEDMLGGIEGIMNLAAASGEELSTTSDIVTDALTAMGYAAGDAGHLADVMAAASSNANTNVALMGQTFQYAAPIAGALKYNMEDVAVSIGLMANAGIKGQKAGTALRSILTRLSAPPSEAALSMEELGISITDSSGKMKSLDTLMRDLRKAFSGLSETQQTAIAKNLAGQEAMSGLLAIVNAAPQDFEKLSQAVRDSAGASQEMATTMTDNVQGQITLLKSKIEGIMIQIFEKLSGTLREAIDNVSNALDRINWDKVADVVGKFAKKLTDLFAFLIQNADKVARVLGVVAGAIATAFVAKKVMDFMIAVKQTIDMIKSCAAAMQILNVIMAASPWILLAAGIAAVIAGIVLWIKKTDEAKRAEHQLTEEQKKQIDVINENAKAYDDLNTSRQEAMDGVVGEYNHLESLIDEYNAHVDANGKVQDSYKGRADFILGELAKAFGMEVDEIKKLIDENGKLGDAIKEVMELKRAEALLNANQDAYNTAIKEQTNAWKEYADAQRLVEDRTRSYNKALDEVNSYKEKGKPISRDARIALEEEEKALNEAREAAYKAKETWQGYNQTIQNYEGLGAAIQTKDAEKIANAMAAIRYNLLTTENADRASLERQKKDFETQLAAMKKAAEEEGSGISDSMIEEMERMVRLCGDEIAKSEGIFRESGENSGENWADGYKKESKNNQKVGKYGATEANKGAASVNNQFSVTGKTAADKYNSSLLEGKTKAYQNGYIIGNSATGGMGAVNPYPVGTREHTEFANGILAGRQKAYDSGKELSTQAKLGAAAVSLAGVGLNLAQGLMSGMNGLLGQVSNVAGDLAQSALNSMKQKLGIASPSKRAEKEVGAQIGAGLTKGLLATTDNVMTASADLANTSIDTMADTLGIRSPSTVARDKIGKNIAKGVIDGLNSYQKATRQSLQKNINSWWKQIDDLNRKKAKASDKTAKNNLQKQIDDLNKKIKTAQTDLANLTKNYNSDLMNRAQSRLSDLQKYDRITLEQEVTYWEKIVASLRKGSNGYSKAYSEATGELKLAKRAYSDYLTQKDDDLVSNLNSKISYLQSLDKISVAQEVNYWNKLIKTLKKGTQAYKDAEVALYQAKKNIRTTSQELAATFTESVGTIKKELSDNVQGIKDQLANDIRGLLDTYTDAVLDRKKQLTNAWGSLFSSINLSPKVSSGKLTENLQLQVDALKAYDKTLSSLEKKLGVNSDIVAELRDQGIDSLHTMQSLDEMTTQELKNYVKLYEQRASIAGKRATKENSQLKKDTNAEIAELKKTANAEIKQLQTDANKQIKELTTTFKSGLKELGASVKGTSKDVGTQITAGIKAGISEGMKDLTGSLRTQTKSLVDTVKKQLKIKSPSQVFRDEIGKMMPPGIAQGFTLAMPKAESEMQQALNEAVTGLKSSVAESTSNIIPFNANGVGGMSGSSNTTNNQVVNFNQTINSPKAVDRLTLYRQTNSLLFGAKVRLNNV